MSNLLSSYLDPNLTHDLTSPTKPWALSPLVATMPHFAHSHKSRPPKFPSSSSLTDDNSQLSLAFHEEDEDAESPLSSASSSTSSLSSGSSSHSGDSGHSSSSSSRKSHSSNGSTSSKIKSLSKIRRGGGHSMSRNGNGAPPPVNLHTAAQRRNYFSVSKNRKSVVFGPEVTTILTNDFLRFITVNHYSRCSATFFFFTSPVISSFIFPSLFFSSVCLSLLTCVIHRTS